MSEHSQFLEMNLDGRKSTYVLGPLAGLELGRFVPLGPPLYIIDQTVASMHPEWIEQIQTNCAHCEQRTLLLPGGEKIKSLAQLGEIYDWLSQQNLPRDGSLVAIGGGTVLDLAGLAASTWRRGVNFVSIPTTLLAMVDAAIGGKTAINAAGIKNPVGTFYPASGVLADVGFLSTLTRSDWRDGMAELIKSAAIGNAELFAEIHAARQDLEKTLGQGDVHQPIAGILGKFPWRRWVQQAAEVKVDLVNRDFREKGPRKSLNLGHTLGHVLEAYSQRTKQPLSHGQAVSIGMAVVFRIAAERNLCPVPQALQMLGVLESCGLPISCQAPPLNLMDELLAGDKKTSARDGLSWVLPERIGKMKINARVQQDELLRWLEAPPLF
ncbi:MAG: 3-dehydroquinate synthase [bacterium]|nr:3-dehydroquinate synthase [bacterium]